MEVMQRHMHSFLDRPLLILIADAKYRHTTVGYGKEPVQQRSYMSQQMLVTHRVSSCRRGERASIEPRLMDKQKTNKTDFKGNDSLCLSSPSFPFQLFVHGDASCFCGMVHSEAISLLSMVPVLFLYQCGPNELIRCAIFHHFKAILVLLSYLAKRFFTTL